MASLRTLPLVSEPRNAVVLLRQRTVKKTPPVPRGLDSSSSRRKVYLPLVEMPAPRCSLDFREMYHGFMALRTPTVCEDGANIPYLPLNESAELCCATTPLDNSAPARRVSVTLLYPNAQHKHSSAWDGLEAAALLAWKVGRDVRISVVCGEDAEWMLSATRKEAKRGALLGADDAEVMSDHDAPRLVVAWSCEEEDGRMCMRRVELHMPRVHGEATSSARALQMCVLYQAEKHGFAAPASLSADLPDSCAAGMYGRAYKAAADEFAKLAKGPPIVERRCLPEEPMPMLEFSGQYVRLCPRVQEQAGAEPGKSVIHDCVVDGADSIHAMLLTAHSQRQAASAFLSLHRDGLRPATSDSEERMQMHVLGVTSVRLEMNASVTLFAGSSSTPGRPINSPRSWMTQLRPVLWPVSHELCHRFFVLPCGIESWRPREDALAPYAMEEALLATELYSGQLACTGHRACDVLDQPIAVPNVSCMRSAIQRSGAPRRADEALLAALQMPITSTRATLGEAYAHVARADPSCELAMLLLRCACKLGPETALVEGFAACANSLKRDRERDHLATSHRHASVRQLIADLRDDEAPKVEPEPPEPPSGCLLAGRHRPPGGATALGTRLIRALAMNPVMVGDTSGFKLSHDRVDTVDLDDMLVYLFDLFEIEARPRKKALRQLLAMVRVHLKLDGFLEALKAMLLSTQESTKVDAVVMFTRQDGSVECVKVESRELLPCAPECVLRHVRPLLVMVSEGKSHPATLRLAPWRSPGGRGSGVVSKGSAHTEKQPAGANGS